MMRKEEPSLFYCAAAYCYCDFAEGCLNVCPDARLTSEEEREEKRTEKNPIEAVKKGAITVVSRSSRGDIQFARS